MSKEDFVRLIELMKSQHKLSLGNLMIYPEYNDDLYKANSILLRNIFNTSQVDWIDWWLYDNEGGDKMLYATQKKNNSVIRIDSVDNLWKAVKSLAEDNKTTSFNTPPHNED